MWNPQWVLRNEGGVGRPAPEDDLHRSKRFRLSGDLGDRLRDLRNIRFGAEEEVLRKPDRFVGTDAFCDGTMDSTVVRPTTESRTRQWEV